MSVSALGVNRHRCTGLGEAAGEATALLGKQDINHRHTLWRACRANAVVVLPWHAGTWGDTATPTTVAAALCMQNTVMSGCPVFLTLTKQHTSSDGLGAKLLF